MPTNPTQPVVGAGRVNAYTAENHTQQYRHSQTQSKQPPKAPLSRNTGSDSFVARKQEGGSGASYRLREVKSYIRLIRESNENLRKAVAGYTPRIPEPCVVPSVLGLSLDEAREQLRQADLRVRRVVQEYHGQVLKWHVVSQVPGPGGVASKQAGVALVISKGISASGEVPIPEKTMEQRSALRVKSKAARTLLAKQLQRSLDESGNPNQDSE